MPARWVVDGTNLVGSRPDGWWRDRPAAFRRLVDELSASLEEPWTVVFDGRPAFEAPDVEWARVADDRIVDLVSAHPEPATLVVVTSDHGLADRVRALGAGVTGTGAFRRRLDGAVGEPEGGGGEER